VDTDDQTPSTSRDADDAPHRGRIARSWERALAVPLVALGIVAVSVLSAVVTWQASEWASRGDRYERLAAQDLAFRHQIRSGIGARIDEDLRLLGRYEEHLATALRLERDSGTVNPNLQRRLIMRAQHERSLANSVSRHFAYTYEYDAANLPRYDVRAARQFFEDGELDLEALRESSNAKLASEASTKASTLVGVALIFACSLFFLTIAQLTRAPTSRHFSLAGSIAGGVALVLFIAA
jgi:hypothetical protein